MALLASRIVHDFWSATTATVVIVLVFITKFVVTLFRKASTTKHENFRNACKFKIKGYDLGTEAKKKNKVEVKVETEIVVYNMLKIFFLFFFLLLLTLL